MNEPFKGTEEKLKGQTSSISLTIQRRQSVGYTIALGGKGGTGKDDDRGAAHSVYAKHNMKPILAIDADSNSNLNDVLGVTLDETLSDAREMMKTSVPVGMTKDIFMEMKMEQSLVEGDGFDLIAMGRPEGPGCYCAANNLLSSLIDRLMKQLPLSGGGQRSGDGAF